MTVDDPGLTRWRFVIIPCQTDFTVQKFNLSSRRSGRSSLTLGAQYFMKKEEAITAHGICALNPVFGTVHTRLHCEE
jgi:hypothetical protein